ncbi:MAG: DNA gyrase C-terminal beta-propeller domain-containing protein, partial [Microcystis sp. M49629_WE12]|nr:DNA gyrase C-terminal beta-propeller domain-containing protein [Microcystis sp. M49629_WE12]
NPHEEFMIITARGIIIRQSVDAITPQSRSAGGIRVQKLDEDDAIAAVALVPPNDGEESEDIWKSLLVGCRVWGVGCGVWGVGCGENK